MNNGWRYKNVKEANRILTGLEYVKESLDFWRARTTDQPDKFLTEPTAFGITNLVNGVPRFMDYIWNVLSKEVEGAFFRPKVISQDPLELTFSQLRERNGSDPNIPVISLAFNLRTINMNHLNHYMAYLGME